MSKCLLCPQKWHIIVKHKFPRATQGNLQSRMFPLTLGGTYMKPRVNQIRNFWWWVKNCTEAIINNMDKYPDIKEEGRDTGLDGNHDSYERKFPNSLSSHSFVIPNPPELTQSLSLGKVRKSWTDSNYKIVCGRTRTCTWYDSVIENLIHFLHPWVSRQRLICSKKHRMLKYFFQEFV